MSWWQWTLLGIGSWLATGFASALVYTRATNREYEEADWAEEAWAILVFWPALWLIGLYEGATWVGRQISPFFRALMLPAKARKNGRKPSPVREETYHGW